MAPLERDYGRRADNTSVCLGFHLLGQNQYNGQERIRQQIKAATTHEPPAGNKISRYMYSGIIMAHRSVSQTGCVHRDKHGLI